MSNVRDNCVLHSCPGGMTVLGRYAQGGHGAVRHGCILMETSMVGIHATLLDGVIVGENRLVSAQALCTKGHKPGAGQPLGGQRGVPGQGAQR